MTKQKLKKYFFLVIKTQNKMKNTFLIIQFHSLIKGAALTIIMVFGVMAMIATRVTRYTLLKLV